MVGTMIERELKFRLREGHDPAQVRAAVESAGFRLEPVGTIAQEDRYVDTDGWTLFRAGIALRMRAEGENLRLEAKTLRSDDGTGLTRTEWAQEAPSQEPPWSGLGPGPVAALLHPLQGLHLLERLQVRARVRNDRECFRWLRGETRLGSLTVDRVSVPPATFEEVEVELENGADEALGEVQRVVQERVGLEQSIQTKLGSALEALGQRLPERDERPFSLNHADRLLDVAHKTFGKHLGRLLWNEPGARLGIDPAYVHDMRVASRRLRTALEVLSAGIPEAVSSELEADLRWVGRGLGRVRDLDVALEHADLMGVEGAPLDRVALHIFRQSLALRRTRRRHALIGQLDSPRFVAFAAKAHDWVQAGPPTAAAVPEGVHPAYAAGPRIIARWMEGMREAFEKAHETLAIEDLHALRIAAKKARYAIEYFADLEGAGAVHRAKRIAGLQDFLGNHRDAVYLLDRMKKYARSVPKKDRDLVMSAGSVLGRLERAARVRRGDLRAAWERAVRE